MFDLSFLSRYLSIGVDLVCCCSCHGYNKFPVLQLTFMHHASNTAVQRKVSLHIDDPEEFADLVSKLKNRTIVSVQPFLSQIHAASTASEPPPVYPPPAYNDQAQHTRSNEGNQASDNSKRVFVAPSNARTNLNVFLISGSSQAAFDSFVAQVRSQLFEGREGEIRLELMQHSNAVISAVSHISPDDHLVASLT
jgi:hypothetical protein